MTQKEYDLAITNLEANYHKGKAEYGEQSNLLKKELDSIEIEYQRKVRDVQQRMRDVTCNIERLHFGYFQRKVAIFTEFKNSQSDN